MRSSGREEQPSSQGWKTRASLAASMFRDITDTWWKSVHPPNRTIADNEARETFKKQLRKKFIPYHITRQKAGFHRLKKKLMTVGEYIHEFTRLSCFAPESMDTEEKKVDRFVEGLRPSIQKDVTMCQRPGTYDDVVDRAYWSEEQHQNVVFK